MSVNLNEWLPFIKPKFMLVPSPMIEQKVIEAARILCEETHIWMDYLDDIDVTANTSDYTLTLPSSLNSIAEIIAVKTVEYKEDGADEDQFKYLDPLGEVLTEEQKLSFDSDTSGWKYATGDTPSRYYVSADCSILSLYPIPEEDSEDGLRVKVILKPLRTVSALHDKVAKYFETITIGATALLYESLPETMGGDELKAISRMGKFRNELAMLKVRRLTGGATFPLTVRLRGDNWL